MNKVSKLSPHDVPGRCMFFPQIIADDEGFLLGMDLEGLTPGTMRSCISVRALKELAHREGMSYPAAVEDLELRLAQSEAERAALSQQITELSEELDSIDGLVKSRDMVVRKKMGRPKVKETV